MEKQDIENYWNLARVIKTIPEKAFEVDPRAQELAKTFAILEQMYFNYMSEVNKHD